MERDKIQKTRFSHLNGEKISNYFSLGSCLDGLNFLVKNLFGLELTVVPPNPGEVWHSSVRKVQVTHEKEGLIGYIFMDLLTRPRKCGHASTFAIEFARYDPLTNKQLGVPKVALICNLGFSNGVPLLSLSGVETLFHEFGHCLSGLLSRTQFHHASGTRAPLDFVETPSTLMEHFAWDHRVVKHFAKHYETGEVLPESVLQNLRQSNHMFEALTTQQQIYFALFDQIIHSNPHANLFKLAKELKEEYTNIPYCDNTHWFSSFGHFSQYPAGYYAYLFCHMFSANIWRTCFLDDPLNRDAGEKYRKEILQYGGAKGLITTCIFNFLLLLIRFFSKMKSS